MNELLDLAKKLRNASYKLSLLSSNEKNKALLDIAALIKLNKNEIFKANELDLKNAEENLLDDSLLRRLKLDDQKLNDIIQGLIDLAKLEEPIGKTLETIQLDENFNLYKVTTPLGVVASIFESRPDALVQIFSLCFKSGNACFLKGGSEAFNTNKKLHSLILNVVDKICPFSTILLESRDDVKEILKLNDFIDLLIPRGSNKFVKFIMDNTNIPVLGHSDGVCHIYVDKEADLEKSLPIVFDSKTQYPAACNAVETLLVHKDIATDFIPMIGFMFKNHNVEMRGDLVSRSLFEMNEASEEDWHKEYNDLIISIKIVDDIAEAIQFININGSKHTDAILTENKEFARRFEREIDSSCVFWNCSTRFSDGFRFGKGAETGISTGKIHARGPVGLEGLIIYKYILESSGATVDHYSKKGYTHKRVDERW